MTVTADSCLGGGDDKAWPPGFRFHPTDEELVVYYLKRKICKKRLKLDIIRVLDVYKWDPEDLPGQSILRTGDRQWFFFTPRDRKYPNGARSNRATGYGYWKATGKDRNILCNSRSVGIKKTLVFYRGRSPNGERTDWVMHEYTLDEEELNRCSNICDYYVLYKVYKKSGPGPKNGEQYGAPFKEEDWLDDDCADDNNPVTPQIPVKKHNDVIPGNNSTCAGEVQPLSSDMEEFMRQITNENALDQHQISDDNYVPPQVAVEKELQSTLVDLSFREVIFPEPDGLLYATSKQENKLDHFKFDQSDASKVQLLEAQEVTSGTSNCEWVTQPCEEDFLEIADLIGPKPISSTTERPPGNLQFDEFDGLSELDFYHDALANMVSVEQETVLHSRVDSLENHMVNNVGYLMQPHLATNQADCQLGPHLMANHVDYQLEPHEGVSVDDYLLQSQLCGPDQINYQFWVHDQSNDVFAYSESIDGTLTQPNLGVGYECTNSSTGANENQNGEDSAGTSGLLSSTIWSFLDSIPSTPASAAESRLVNNAVKRMSSFSRLRLNIKNTNIDAGDVASSAGSSGRNKGLIFLSIFGAFCAVLWVLVGTLRVTGRSIS